MSRFGITCSDLWFVNRDVSWTAHPAEAQAFTTREEAEEFCAPMKSYRHLPGVHVAEIPPIAPPAPVKTIRCTDCGSEFSDAETEGVHGCPVCKATGLPCAIADDATVKINWHELRILGIWASNWAEEKCGKSEQQTVKHILARLEAQAPRKEMPPLTLMGELQQIAESGMASSVEIHRAGSVTKVEKKS